jgi:hypothetical protein
MKLQPVRSVFAGLVGNTWSCNWGFGVRDGRCVAESLSSGSRTASR